VSRLVSPEAQAEQGAPAGLVSRTSAGIIDLGVVVIASLTAVALASVWAYLFGGLGQMRLAWPSRGGLAALGGIVLASYLSWGWARTGRTVGKRLLGLTVVARDGAPPGWPTATARALLYVVFPVGLFWCAVSVKRRSLQDVALKTHVIYDWFPHAVQRQPYSGASSARSRS
jgi:uncharacterized RDD family membrane protein YckC